MPSPDAQITREEVRFQSGETECAAVLLRPDAADDVPCVVLGHGFGAVKEGGLIRSGERFAEAGYASLAFDYRYFGESGGEPRQLLDISKQLDDWQAAVAFARGQAGIDPDRIAIWGSSFGGGHVWDVAASDPRIAAAISQVPYIDGVKTLLGLGPVHSLRLTVAALADFASGLIGRGPRRIAIVGRPGSTAAMTTPDALPGYSSIYDPEFEWRNEFVSRVALKMPLYRPGRRAPSLGCPILVQVASDDAITPPGPAIEAAGNAPKGELITYAGLGHFDIYRGEPFEQALSDQLDFLGRHLSA